MKTITSKCPACQFALQIPDESWLGKTAKCPNCESKFVLAAETAQSPTEIPEGSTQITIAAETPTASFEGDASAPAATRSEAPAFQQLVDHRYELVERLGGGGFGVVWKARDLKLDRIVALKVPRQELFDEDSARQVQREAQAAARLKHPNIVAVYEVKIEGERNYIVSEYIEGITLNEWAEEQTISSRQAAELALKLANTMHHAHEAKVVHRDLKPGNVLIDALGEIHITDFGLAKRDDLESSMSEDGRAMGTPAYMSPEQARGTSRQADRRTDVYSLGVMLFELLTGERPFRGNKWGALQYQILAQEPPKPRTINPDVPLDLDTICLKCLEKEPSKRYQTAKALAEELQRFLNGEPILSRPIGRTARFWRACKRQPVVASLSAVLLVALILGSVITTYFGVQANDRAKEADEAKNEALAERDKAQQNEQWALDAEKQLRDETNRVRVQQARQNVAEGFRQLDLAYDNGRTHSWPEHLLWFAQALELSPEDSEEEQINRMRLASALSQNPLEDFWPNVRFAAFSPKGDQVVTTNDDGNIEVFDANTRKRLALLRASNLPIVYAAFSPDGSKLAAVGHHKKATVWDLSTKEVIYQTPELTDAPISCAFNGDGDIIFVMCFPGKLERFGLPSHISKTEFPPLDSKYRVVTLSPNAKRALATLDDKKTAVLIDTLSGTKIGEEMRHRFPIKGAVFSADNSLVATYTEFSKFPETRTRRVEVPVNPNQNQDNNPTPSEQAAPVKNGFGKKGGETKIVDEAYEVEVEASFVQVFAGDFGGKITDAIECPHEVEAITLDPKNQTLAAGGSFNHRALPEKGPPPTVPDAAPSRNFIQREGSPVFRQRPRPVKYDGFLSVWPISKPSSGSIIQTHEPIQALGFSEDGFRLVSAGKDRSSNSAEVGSWTVENGRIFDEYPPWLVEFAPKRVFVANDRVLVSGTHYNQGGARMWNWNRSVVQGRLANSGKASMARFIDDGQQVEIATMSEHISYDCESLKRVDNRPPRSLQRVTQTVTIPVFEERAESFVVNFDVAPVTMQRTRTVSVPRQEIREYAVSQDFRTVCDAWHRENALTFDISSVTLATSNLGRVVGVSPDQKELIYLEESGNFGRLRSGSANATGRLRLFHAETGKPLSRGMRVRGDVQLVRMNPSQRLLAVVTQEDEITILPPTDEAPAPPADPAAAVPVDERPTANILGDTYPVSFQAPAQENGAAWGECSVMVWDLDTGRPVMPALYFPEGAGSFIQFDEPSRRFVVKLQSAVYLFDLLPDWLPAKEETVLLTKWAAFHDFDETGAVEELDRDAIGKAWNDLVR